MTNDNDARGALTEIAKAAWDEAWRLAFDDGMSAGHPLGRSRLDRETEWADSEVVAHIAKLPAGDGLTDEQIVAIAAKSGIGPNSAIEFARAILAAPRQPGEMGAGDEQHLREMVQAAIALDNHSEIEACQAYARQVLTDAEAVKLDMPDQFCSGYKSAIQEIRSRLALDGWYDAVRVKADKHEDVYAKGTDQVEFAQRLGKSASAQQDEREALSDDAVYDIAIREWKSYSAQPYSPDGLHFAAIAVRDAVLRAARQVQADAGAVAYIPDDALARLTPPLLVLDGVRLYRYNGVGTTALYTRPAADSDKRVEMTDSQIEQIAAQNGLNIRAYKSTDKSIFIGAMRAVIESAMPREQSGGDRG